MVNLGIGRRVRPDTDETASNPETLSTSGSSSNPTSPPARGQAQRPRNQRGRQRSSARTAFITIGADMFPTSAINANSRPDAVADIEAAISSANPNNSSSPNSSGSSPSSAEPSRAFIEVLGMLAEFRHNHERLKLYRVSMSVIRFLSVLNVFYTILGLGAITIGSFGLTDAWISDISDRQREQFYNVGLMVCIFAPMASVVDFAALRGLRTWKRFYLLPWLFLYAFVICLIFAQSLAGVFHHGLKWTYVILLVCVLCFFSAWRHVRLQYTDMLRDRPTPVTIDQLAHDVRERTAAARSAASGVTSTDPAGDLPPKYEDLDQPPTYEERFGPSSTTTTVENETSASQSEEENQNLSTNSTELPKP